MSRKQYLEFDDHRNCQHLQSLFLLAPFNLLLRQSSGLLFLGKFYGCDELERPAWFVLTRHWLSLLGVALVATAVISWLFVLPQQVRGHVDNPYVGIVVFLILPAIFFTGLAVGSDRRLPEQTPDSPRAI